MYNGIGLQTARGSGTNGYVQKNLGAIRYHKDNVSSFVSLSASMKDPGYVEGPYELLDIHVVFVLIGLPHSTRVCIHLTWLYLF